MGEENFGIAVLSIVPVRREPSDSSEQVSQLLFGDTFRILEQKDKWLFIQSTWDEYEGWIDLKQVIQIQGNSSPYNSTHPHVCLDILNPLHTPSGLQQILIGSTLPRFDGNNVRINEQDYAFFGKAVESGSSAISGKLEDVAMQFLNAPYLWGGKSVFGIDCSGFTQVVYKILGYRLKRDAYQQAEQGTLVNFFEESKAGDLAFFDNEEERITHVGIILDGGRIIHASGKVRIDVLDHQGIFNAETKRYSHKLRIIKRL